MAEIQRLTLKILGENVGAYIQSDYKKLSMFTVINLLFLAALGFGGIGTLWFLGWSAAYYLFNFVFFRCVFGRKPYLLTTKFFDTLLPAAKMLFSIMLVFTVLAYLPYLPLLFPGMSEHWKNLITAFIGDFMGESNIYNIFISIVLLLCSPMMLYRPMLAWIAAVIGRSGSFKNVFKRTDGYSRLFLGIFAMFYLFAAGLQITDTALQLHGYLFWPLAAPLTLLWNLVLAKTYELLFLS